MPMSDEREDGVSRRLPNTPAKPHDYSPESIELRPDGDARFRAAVRAAAKSGPKHRPAKEAKG